MSGIFLLIFTLTRVHEGKKSPPPVNLSPVKVTRVVNVTMWFDWEIKICRTLSLDCLRSAGFFDRRTIFFFFKLWWDWQRILPLEFVIDAFLVCISGLHILWPSLLAPWPPSQWVNTACLSPCPLIATAGPGVLSGHWKVKHLGQGRGFFLFFFLFHQVYGKKHI